MLRAPSQRSHTLWRYLLPTVAGTALLAVLLAWSHGHSPQADDSPPGETTARAGPPWRYGRTDARFTLIEYADLECTYCQAYVPKLKRWIDANPDVNWQWHHVPLPTHEPAATRGARLAECAGETSGRTAFWNAIAWIYQHSLGNGQGLPPGAHLPGSTTALYECLASTRPDAVIRAQAQEAARAGIAATPTLRVIDNTSGKSMLLPGAVEGDALLSAIDLLASSSGESQTTETLPEVSEMPADSVSDMPR